MDKQKILENFLNLVKIPGPSKYEKDVAEYVCNKLKDLGFTVRVDDVGEKINGNTGNVFAYKNSNHKTDLTLLFSSHMDTVKPCDNVNPIIKNDRVFSDGTTILGADDRSGINAILTGFEYVFDSGMDYPNIEIVFTVAEEIGLYGSRYIDSSNLKSKTGFVFDCSLPPGNIVTQTPSSVVFDIICKGRASHAAVAPEKGVHSIMIASRAISQLKTGLIDEDTIFNIGTISGGTATNVVPEQTIVQGEVRCFNEEKLMSVLENTKKIFKTEAENLNGFIDFKIDPKYKGFKLTEENSAVQIICKAIKRIGKECTFKKYVGGSDANNFNEKGIQTVNIGLGTENVHSKRESIPIENLIFASNLLVEIIRESTKSK